VLADFRSWLLQTVLSPADNGPAAAAPTEPVDLHTLLGQFIALRHEVNLQTKAVRAQQEQNAEALDQLGEAVELLRQQRQQPAAATGDEEAAVRPLLKTLIDVHDSLNLASREVQRVQTAVLPALDQRAPKSPAPVTVPIWASLLGAGGAVRKALAAAEERREADGQALARVRQLVTSIVTGYTMSVQRVERALAQYGLEALPCVGQPFDPERMEAVEVVAEAGRTTTEVIEEVRRGYLWRGRVFRFAQVRVARPER
jgi:molecular chaperone GrpE